MESQDRSTDVAIVGGGMAGLTAAAYLARAGVSVTLYEKAADLGGRAATQTVDGYQHNRGIHALYTGGAAETALRDLGVAYTAGKPELKAVSLLHRGRLHAAPTSLTTLLTTTALSLGDKLEMMRVFAALGSLDAYAVRHTGVQAWIDTTIRRPQVRTLFALLARTAVYSANLDLVSAELFICRTQIGLKHPALYIDGGWQVLVDGLRKAAQTAGATLAQGARVEGVQVEAGRVVGVRLRDGNVARASAVIIATPPHDAVKLVDSGVYPALRRTVDSLIPAQIACLDVALTRLPDPRHPIVQDMDQPCFFSTQSEFSRVTPPGGALIYAFKQLDPTGTSDPKADERDLEQFLDVCQPGWREVVVRRFFLPRIDAVGALPTASGGGFAGRPTPDAAGIRGLYLAGDWIGDDGFLVDASMASARQVAQRLAGGELTSLRSQERATASMIG